MHCNTLKQDNDSTVRGDGGSRVGEVVAEYNIELEQVCPEGYCAGQCDARMRQDKELVDTFV